MASRYELVPGYLRLAGYTMQEVADHLGISRRTLDNKIFGISDFTLTEALEIKALVGKPIDEIFLAREVAKMPHKKEKGRSD